MIPRVFNLLVIVFIFVNLFILFAHPITAFTQDLGRHLLLGKVILQTHTVPKTNMFSYTHPDFQFINTHWFSEVIFYLLFQQFGIVSLLLLTLICSFSAFSITFFYALKKGSLLAVMFVSFLAIGVLGERTNIRPEVFSFLFLASFVTILYYNRETKTKLVWLLPVIELFWVNIHIYFIIGIIVVGLFTLDHILTQRQTLLLWFRKKTHFPISLTTLLLITLLCILVTLCNPYGLYGAIYPFYVFHNYGYTIEENQNIFFLWEYAQKPIIIFFWVYVFVLFLSLLLTFRRTKPIDWFLAIIFTFLAASAVRNFPLFVLTTIIPFTIFLNSLAKMFVFSQKNYIVIKTIIYLMIIVLFSWNSNLNIQKRSFGFSVIPGIEPATSFFVKNNLKGPIFNNFDIGSYLIFRLYPKEKIFVDGRPEAYPASFFQNTYIPMQQDEKLFDQQDKKYNFNVIIFSITDQTPWAQTFLRNIVHNQQWQPVYLDEMNIILVKRNKTNETVIKKNAIDLQSIDLNLSEKDMQSLYPLINFFAFTGYVKQEEKVLTEVLKRDPENCQALYLMGLILYQQKIPAFQTYTQKYQLICQPSMIQ